MTAPRIMIVDDEERLRKLLAMLLSDMKCKLTLAEDGREALEKCRQAHPHLVITDLKMPGVDGIALTQAISDLNSGTVVVWITAYGCAQVSDEATRLSVYECLEKPLRIDEIRRVVREALENTGG